MKKILALIAILFMVSAPSVMAQEPCKADFDCSGGVDAGDVDIFLAEWNHRTIWTNPCTCVDTSCPCTVPVAKTGQTIQYDTGDDGDLEPGVTWPNPRFTDNGNGTVTDNLTELIWMKDANCAEFDAPVLWSAALYDCRVLHSPDCGLTDGSSAFVWRLPTKNELDSLLHLGYSECAIPNTSGTGQWSEGDPFIQIQGDYYWSSTTRASDTTQAFTVNLCSPSGGSAIFTAKEATPRNVWCVRDQQIIECQTSLDCDQGYQCCTNGFDRLCKNDGCEGFAGWWLDDCRTDSDCSEFPNGRSCCCNHWELGWFCAEEFVCQMAFGDCHP